MRFPVEDLLLGTPDLVGVLLVTPDLVGATVVAKHIFVTPVV